MKDCFVVSSDLFSVDVWHSGTCHCWDSDIMCDSANQLAYQENSSLLLLLLLGSTKALFLERIAKRSPEDLLDEQLSALRIRGTSAPEESDKATTYRQTIGVLYRFYLRTFLSVFQTFPARR